MLQNVASEQRRRAAKRHNKIYILSKFILKYIVHVTPYKCIYCQNLLCLYYIGLRNVDIVLSTPMKM